MLAAVVSMRPSADWADAHSRRMSLSEIFRRKKLFGALEQRGVTPPIQGHLEHVMAMNDAISDEFSA